MIFFVNYLLTIGNKPCIKALSTHHRPRKRAKEKRGMETKQKQPASYYILVDTDGEAATYDSVHEIVDWFFSDENDTLTGKRHAFLVTDGKPSAVDIDELEKECRDYVRSSNEYRAELNRDYYAARAL